jgi:hypothetical protein
MFALSRAAARVAQPLRAATLACVQSAAHLPSTAAASALAGGRWPAAGCAGGAAASLAPAVPCRHMSGKTKSAVKKRFRVNGGGQLLRKKSGSRHLNMHKSASRLTRLGAC